jgi:hypothetical protein
MKTKFEIIGPLVTIVAWAVLTWTMFVSFPSATTLALAELNCKLLEIKSISLQNVIDECRRLQEGNK